MINIDKWENWFAIGAVVVLVGITIWIFGFLVPKQIDRENRAKELAHGCMYLGHAKELNTVFFYDCDGVVIMKRVK